MEAPPTKHFLQEISLGTNLGIIQTMWLLRLCLYVSAEHKLFQLEHFLVPPYWNDLKAISFVTKTILTSCKHFRMVFF